MSSNWVKPAKFTALLKKHKAVDRKDDVLPGSADWSDPIAHLVHAWLLWESSTTQADAAMEKIIESRVDFNELRVSLPHELAMIVGKRYPRHEERFTRLKQTLQAIYLNQHAMTLEHLRDLSKKQAKTYLDRLTGMHPFVSSRVLSIAFGGHAIPADEQLVEVLIEHGVITEQVETKVVISWMTAQVRAADAEWAIPALQSVCDAAWEDGTVTKINRRRRAEQEAAEAAAESKRLAKIAAEKAALKAAEKAAKAAADMIAKKAAAKKAEVKKAEAKKVAAKKAAADKIAKKAAADKIAKKAAADKIVKKAAAKKAEAKKVEAKKAAAKKAAAKKVAAKKVAAKKVAAKKVAAKKVAAKKVAAKKSSAKKAATKKTAKKVVAKKKVSKKKAPARKDPKKKSVKKPAGRKKTTKKKASRTKRS